MKAFFLKLFIKVGLPVLKSYIKSALDDAEKAIVSSEDNPVDEVTVKDVRKHVDAKLATVFDRFGDTSL